MKDLFLVNAEEMRRCDNHTIERFHVPAIVLMERAALGISEEIKKYWKQSTGNVLIAAGTGNNGADGIAAGRLLQQAGFAVTFFVAGDREKYSSLMERQIAIVKAYGCEVCTGFPEGEYDIIVDALFGIGLSRDLGGIYLQAVEKINESRAFTVSVDIPSGIHTDSGAVMGAAVKADITVTFAYRKLGQVLYPGASYTGEVIVKDIGITRDSFCGQFPGVFFLQEAAEAFLPERDKGGNKGTFGKVLVIAGNEAISGACLLSAEAAFRIGCGMVRILTHKDNRIILAQKLPEAMLNVYRTKEELSEMLEEGCGFADCILIGPGCGVGWETEEKLKFVIEKSKKPLVIDADGLNQIAENPDLYRLLKESIRKNDRAVILTPHLGEFSRLSGKSVEEIKGRFLEEAKEYAEEAGCIVVCKDARTLVAAKGHAVYLNLSGNCGMATAGSGDVLAGMITGILAQAIKKAAMHEAEREAAFEAAVAGVYLHGLAGDAACSRRKKGAGGTKNEHTLLAGDLIKQFDFLF